MPAITLKKIILVFYFILVIHDSRNHFDMIIQAWDVSFSG